MGNQLINRCKANNSEVSEHTLPYLYTSDAPNKEFLLNLTNFKKSSFNDNKIGRITGLDPAGPLYGIPILINSKKRLTKGDALFVDIIHTCAGVFGMPQIIGDVDFYPNGGSSQPGCSFLDFNCKHFRAALYYAESVSSNTGFVAYKCTSWEAYTEETCANNEKQLMGYPVTATSNGKYYLTTNAKSPFAQGDL
ncbi:lipase member H-like [Chrysoperla carnea]|uniref:lipase member H-like n=1 Tax=Chrysoperla carnea TaxID=189513 RepID=UPI001D06F4B9|nr:lipase member H-like [Chrysoperla carnea]